MFVRKKIMKSTGVGLVSGVLLLAGCAGGPLTTREKGAGIGALGGAAAGGLIGAAVGRPGTGAAIGGALGLGAGALVGDQLQGQENTNYYQQQQINRNQAEIQRNRQQIQRLQRDREY
jgi:outer membrane lipoprotein SlyB